MDARCRIEVFGDLRVIRGEQTHTRFRTRKAGYLLAYLALNLQQAQPRERLADLFWGDKEEAVGRDGLSTALAQLRRQLEPTGVPTDSLFVADKLQVRLNPVAVSTDVADFDRLLDQARQSEDKQKKAVLLQKAVGLYRGDLLPGCYEEWATGEQTRCRLLCHESLLHLTQLWEEAGRYAEALAMAQRVCAMDPFAEEGYRAQMRLLVRLRKPSIALQTYEGMEQLFQRELGARPAASTRQMAEAIRQDPRAALLMRAEVAASAHVSAPLSEAKTASPSESSVTSGPSVPPALPLQLTRFFGREQEREQVGTLLQTPGIRLVSLLGPGGAGKTRLALEVAAQVAPFFANRVWFVSLADVPDASLLLSALVHALHLPPDAAGNPLDYVVAHLGSAPSLLVLDNMEHLLRELSGAGKNDNPAQSGSVALIRLLLQRAPGLVCLVTSRTALRIGGEQEFPLPPLALPVQEETLSLTDLLRNPSIALYVDRARAVRPDFALTAQNAPAVVTLCQRLEGMPLALEMAAAWIKTLPPSKILERLTHQLDLLVSRRRDLPPRHQSLRATIEWSYELLAPELQTFFASLGVFRGGWTLQSAEAVCGRGALHALMALQEHSLIVAVESELAHYSEKKVENDQKASEEVEEAEPRYRMLEPLREFAQEKLTEREKAGIGASLLQTHSAYFCSLVSQAWNERNTPDLKNWLDRLQTEQENVRAALTWLEANDPEIGLQMAGRLWRFWELRGYAHEGRVRLCALLERCGNAPPTTDRAHAHNAAGNLAASVGDYPDALHHYEQSQQIAHALGDLYYVALAKQQCGLAARGMGDANTAAGLLEEALALYQQQGRHDMVANNQSNLAVIAMEQNDYSRAQELLTEALRFQRGAGDLRSIAITLNNLGGVALSQGDCSRARACQSESLQITCEIGAKASIAYALEAFADIAVYECHWARAAYFWGVAHRMREANNCPLPPAERTDYEAQLTKVKSYLREEEFVANWNAGQAVSLKQAVASALADVIVLQGSKYR